VTKMDTGFQHFAHGDRHEINFQRLVLKSSPDCTSQGGTSLCR
jgi:hypothetical protein